MRAKRGIGSAAVKGRRVLVRVDFNVPLDPQGQVADDRRIVEALPTIHHLTTAGARVILMSHLGRPDGRKDARYSLRPVVRRLGTLLGRPVPLADDPGGMRALELTARLGNGDVMMLENLRFNPGEEANDPTFAAQLARLGELFVEDAFGTVHRAHASTVGVPQRLPAFAGLLVEKEVRELSRLVDEPARPYAVLVGGAKVADKLPLLESFVGRADVVLIGGALAFPFLAARGSPPGGAPPPPELVGAATRFLAHAAKEGTTVVVPSDLVAAPASGSDPAVYPVGALPSGAAEDIGPATRAAFAAALRGAKTVFWNGPLGRAEDPRFVAGTREVLASLADNTGFKVAAGGDSARVAHDLGVEGVFQFISTGGGASLEFVQGVDLPGLAVLPDA